MRGRFVAVVSDCTAVKDGVAAPRRDDSGPLGEGGGDLKARAVAVHPVVRTVLAQSCEAGAVAGVELGDW